MKVKIFSVEFVMGLTLQ